MPGAFVGVLHAGAFVGGGVCRDGAFLTGRWTHSTVTRFFPASWPDYGCTELAGHFTEFRFTESRCMPW